MFTTIKKYFHHSKREGLPLWIVLGRIPVLALRKILYTLKHWYRHVFKTSIFFQESEMYMCSLFPQKTLEVVVKMFHPRSVLDLGCGVGRSLDFFVSRGIEVLGVEGSSLAISKAKNKHLIKRFNLNKELCLERTFDLIWSLEVVEHIHPDYVENLMKSFSNHADTVVLSAALPEQGGEGHFNEQLPEYWIGQFKRFGYMLKKQKTNRLRATKEKFSTDILVFER